MTCSSIYGNKNSTHSHFLIALAKAPVFEIDEELHLLYKHQWNTKWAFPRKLHIFTREDNMLSSHVKRSPSLWLHNKSHLWKQADLVFHWCLYNKQNITYSLMDMNFIFSWSTRYLTRSLRSLVRYRVDHSKIKFISTRGHVISSIYLYGSVSQGLGTTKFTNLIGWNGYWPRSRFSPSRPAIRPVTFWSEKVAK